MTEHRTAITHQFAYRNPVCVALFFANDGIKKNLYDLNSPSYVDTFENTLITVRKERLALQKELDGLQAEMAGYLGELRYDS